ncbi:TPR-like protein [Wallemia mellicola]|uniref:TPR-like protein n=1 Tax=Wallemia mellicola TaxID=1708541 RepID=A0A4T0M6Z1_9BASI|nr:TPR-like protein [Wallemia mellicola]TIC16134.1 TPR-like protein [Wallemia mellicola]TIC34196.1 TPR-like protein [Wallemia mellicola]
MQRSWPANYVVQTPILRKLALANEDAWLTAGALMLRCHNPAHVTIAATAESMNDAERALVSYQNALVHSPYSVPALSAVGAIYRQRENFPKAIEFYQRALNVQQDNGDIWSALGHAYLMIDDLQKAYTAYQQALYHLPAPKLQDPKLWYGIGILYDRYGSLEHAEEAFAGVIKIAPDFEKANEIYFRLGIIYKQQQKFSTSLDCFRYILTSPPKPLSEIDIWFQIGHVYEQQKEYTLAREAYERVLIENPEHAKVLQQLGWLYHQTSATNNNDQELAIQYLTKSLGVDPTDPQSWYLLGRSYMAGQKFNKAYEAYQQAVYRDGRNPTFWCSIGVLYYQINQYRDALDAYSRAIRLNPYISEVWFDLGSLYESCHNQISDAIDAYARAADLDPTNPHVKQRLQLLKNVQANGGSVPAAPVPQDVHPTAYAQPQAVSSSTANSEGQTPYATIESADSVQQQQQQRMTQAHGQPQSQVPSVSSVSDVEPTAPNGAAGQPVPFSAGLPGRQLNLPRDAPMPVQRSEQQFVSYTPAHYEDGRPVVDWEGRPVSVQRFHSPVPKEAIKRNSSILSPPPVNSHPSHLSQSFERTGNGTTSRNSRYDPRMDGAPSQPVVSNPHQESPPRLTPKSVKGRKSLAFHAQRMEDSAYTPPPLGQEASSYTLHHKKPTRPRPSIESPASSRRASATTRLAPVAQPSTSSIHNNGRYSQSPQSEDDTNAAAVPPVARVVDEDYDEGAADALMGLAGAAAASDRQPIPPNIREPLEKENGPNHMIGVKRNTQDGQNDPNKRQREDKNGSLSPENDPAAFPRKHSMNTMNTPPADDTNEDDELEGAEDSKDAVKEAVDAHNGEQQQQPQQQQLQEPQARPVDQEMRDA